MNPSVSLLDVIIYGWAAVTFVFALYLFARTLFGGPQKPDAPPAFTASVMPPRDEYHDDARDAARSGGVPVVTRDVVTRSVVILEDRQPPRVYGKALVSVLTVKGNEAEIADTETYPLSELPISVQIALSE